MSNNRPAIGCERGGEKVNQSEGDNHYRADYDMCIFFVLHFCILDMGVKLEISLSVSEGCYVSKQPL